MKEIERKFIIDINKWQPQSKGIRIKQGYLSTDPARTVRVRIADKKAFLTVKGKTTGISRTELEYEIPVNEAEILIGMCLDFVVVKNRFFEKYAGKTWEIDVFEEKNKGLFLAEIELENETDFVEKPNWIKTEVSEDYRYYNSWLSQNPFGKWKY